MVNQKYLEITGNTWKYQEKYLVILEKYLEYNLYLSLDD